MNKECFVNETRALPVLIVDPGCFDPEVVILGSLFGLSLSYKRTQPRQRTVFRRSFPICSSKALVTGQTLLDGTLPLFLTLADRYSFHSV